MKLHFDTATDVRKSLNYVANKVMTGDIDVKTANCIAYLSNAALSAIRESHEEYTGDVVEKIGAMLAEIPSVID